MGFFDRLKSGLQKTKEGFSDRVNTLFSAFTKIDEELFEELEESLILSDVGVNVASAAVEQLRKVCRQQKLHDQEGVRNALRDILSKIRLYQ